MSGRPTKTDSSTLPSSRPANPFLSLALHQCCLLPSAGIPDNALTPTYQTPCPSISATTVNPQMKGARQYSSKAGMPRGGVRTARRAALPRLMKIFVVRPSQDAQGG